MKTKIENRKRERYQTDPKGLNAHAKTHENIFLSTLFPLPSCVFSCCGGGRCLR